MVLWPIPGKSCSTSKSRISPLFVPWASEFSSKALNFGIFQVKTPTEQETLAANECMMQGYESLGLAFTSIQASRGSVVPFGLNGELGSQKLTNKVHGRDAVL
jgi:hypothetical protein